MTEKFRLVKTYYPARNTTTYHVEENVGPLLKRWQVIPSTVTTMPDEAEAALRRLRKYGCTAIREVMEQ